MARDQWGFGPNFPGYRDSKGPVCSLTVPQECYWNVRARVREFVPRVYDHLEGQNGTRKLRIYGRSSLIRTVLEELQDSLIPYDFVNEHSTRHSHRCFPDGGYKLYEDLPEYALELSWANQWHLRSVLKTIRLINPQEFPEPEYL